MRTLKTLSPPVLCFAAAVGVAGCSGDSAGPEFGADVEDVAEPPGSDDDEPLSEEDDPREEADPQTFVGRTVTVSAEVSEVISPGVIRIGDDDSVLVFSGSRSFEEIGVEVTEDLVENDVVVQVTGTVRQFLLSDFEDEFGIDYNDQALDEFAGESVIVADRVSTLAGEEMTIAGEVQDVVSPTAFSLEGFGWNVVVLDAARADVAEGDFVQVQGTVRRLRTADLEEELGVDLDEEAYEPYEGKLVLVADDVLPSAPVSP